MNAAVFDNSGLSFASSSRPESFDPETRSWAESPDPVQDASSSRCAGMRGIAGLGGRRYRFTSTRPRVQPRMCPRLAGRVTRGRGPFGEAIPNIGRLARGHAYHGFPWPHPSTWPCPASDPPFFPPTGRVPRKLLRFFRHRGHDHRTGWPLTGQRGQVRRQHHRAYVTHPGGH